MRRLRAAELFEQGVPNVLIAGRLGVSDSAVDLWKARWVESTGSSASLGL
jgi:transposase